MLIVPWYYYSGLSEPGVPIGLSPSVGPRMMPELIDVAIAYATSDGHRYLLNTKGGDPTPIEVFCLSCFTSLFLPPSNEVWGKVIFSQACVKNSVHGEGGGVAWSGGMVCGGGLQAHT